MATKKDWGLFILRMLMAWTFLWAFFDKLLGLGFSTCVDKTAGTYKGMLCAGGTFLTGGSPTTGYLSRVGGMLGPLFQKMAGVGLVDWLFMLGLLGIGVSMLFGAGMNLGSYGGATLMMLMYFASFKPFITPGTNPLNDGHLTEAVILLVLNWTGAGTAVWSLSKWWNKKSFVKNRKWLQ